MTTNSSPRPWLGARGSLAAALVAASPAWACGPDATSENLPPGAFTSGPLIDTFDDLGISASDDGTDDGVLTGATDGVATVGGEESTGEVPCEVPNGLSHATDIAPIWEGSCAVADSCHVAGGTQVPDLEEGAYDTLLNESSVLVGASWVVVGDPDQSYVYLKIANRHDELGGGGGAMPLAPGEMTTCEAMIVQAWIEQGAAP